jgi:hypothetical protein
MAGIEQLFRFEQGYSVLSDGSIFRPLETATHRWHTISRCGPQFGLHWNILYETADGKYVHVRYLNCVEADVQTSEDEGTPPKRMWCGEGVEAPYLMRAFEAERFVKEMNGAVTESLTKKVEQESQEASEAFERSIRARETPTRPLGEWKLHSRIPVMRLEMAHQVTYPKLARVLYRSCVTLVQFLREPIEGLSPHSKLTQHGPCSSIVADVFAGYYIDPEHWWGADDVVPPKYVSIVDLPWPEDLRPYCTALRALQVAIDEPAHCLTAGPHDEFDMFRERPTDADSRDAVNALRGQLQVIERATASMGKCLRKLAMIGRDSGSQEATTADPLPERVRLAFNAFETASEAIFLADGTRATDDQAYIWLQDHGPVEYELPDVESWKRYLREGRRKLGAQKNKPRVGRTGGSIASADEI